MYAFELLDAALCHPMSDRNRKKHDNNITPNAEEKKYVANVIVDLFVKHLI